MRMFVGVVVVGLSACTVDSGECVALADGTWTVDGTAFGMEMTGVVAMDVAQCAFTIGDWDMEMASMPTGGTVDGDQISFEGDDFWQSCAGTVNADGTEITGACDDGSDLTMSADGGATTPTDSMPSM